MLLVEYVQCVFLSSPIGLQKHLGLLLRFITTVYYYLLFQKLRNKNGLLRDLHIVMHLNDIH